jgi:hypothetical protein
MRLEQLLTYFDTSPAVRLLRAQSAPFVLDFLHQQFKAAGRIAIPASDLLAALAEYSRTLHETQPAALLDKPEQYLAVWCSGDTRWLQRLLERSRNEPVFQLTAHTEDVFVFLDRAMQKDLGFVGTESRLRMIISTLADLVAGASHDPAVRLAHLHEERRRIDDEIARVHRDGVTARYEPVAVRERFVMAVALLKELLADFRAVEDRFKEITRQVQQRHVDGKDSRGSILEYALDAEDVLKQDDQGVSFQEFYRFIASPERQDKLQTIITELSRIDELAPQRDGLATVRRMVPSLLADAEKVMRTNHRLSATLRRLLDTRAASDRQRVARVIAEIRSVASQLAPQAPVEGIGVMVDEGITIAAPFSRTFWGPPATFEVSPVVLAEQLVDDARRLEVFRQLALLHRLDWKAMRGRVESIARRDGSATLRQIVEEYPPAAGVVELLGYLQIARDDGHVVSREHQEEIVLYSGDPSGIARRLTVPMIVFLPPQERSTHAAGDSGRAVRA